MKIELLKVGADIEVFLKDKQDVPVTVCGRVGGTKEEPLPVLGGNGFAVQEDNVMLEFNIPPAGSAEEFHNSITEMMGFLCHEMSKQELTVVPVSSMYFRESSLNCEQAFKFGCEPDFDVWNKSVNHVHASALNTGSGFELRAAGFHIHISYTNNGLPPDIETTEFLIKALDLFVAVPSLIVDRDDKRRMFYGKAGAFRIKPYGLEYRVLGSGVLRSKNLGWIYNGVSNAVSFLNGADEGTVTEFLDKKRALLKTTIDRTRIADAMALCGVMGLSMPITGEK